MFRLNVDLIERLKELAKREHRSLNNFVECVLLDVAYNEPSELTKTAIEEARSGKLRDVPSVDTTSVEAMFKSTHEIDQVRLESHSELFGKGKKK